VHVARDAVAAAVFIHQLLRRRFARALARSRAQDRCDCCVSLNLGHVMDFISILSIFVLACFVGYYVVWSVTPALHTPLMSVTNAISSVIVVGALIASAAAGSPTSKWLGLLAVALASVNIFGGFAVTARMLAMYKKRERPGGKTHG
jgi:H+-translocating NAD(P) transhydrogenase subunit alpha